MCVFALIIITGKMILQNMKSRDLCSRVINNKYVVDIMFYMLLCSDGISNKFQYLYN